MFSFFSINFNDWLGWSPK